MELDSYRAYSKNKGHSSIPEQFFEESANCSRGIELCPKINNQKEAQRMTTTRAALLKDVECRIADHHLIKEQQNS